MAAQVIAFPLAPGRMFLIRQMRGCRPRVYPIDSSEVIGTELKDDPSVRRRRERAWWIHFGHSRVPIGAAAIAETVARCYFLLAKLRGEETEDDVGI